MEPLVGRVLNNKYQIVKLIGRGGMGAVYEAVHCDLDKQVAVKTLLPQLAENEEVYKRFLLEARAASRLRHPHIIEVTDFDHTDDGMPFMVLEYLEGEDLSQALSRQGRLEPERAYAIFRDVLSAMEAAHQAGIVHRDLKPQNIFLCRYGDRTDFPKVLDFGISKVLDATGGLTGTTAYVGTPNYMAPEQADGRSGEVDSRSDVFALGAILYRVLGGQDAFPGDRVATILYKIVNEDPPPLAEKNPSLTPAVVAVVHRAMARDPDDRFPSMATLGEALLPALTGDTLPWAGAGAAAVVREGEAVTVVQDRVTRKGFPPATEPDAAAKEKEEEEDISLASTLGQSVGEIDPAHAPPRKSRRSMFPLVALAAVILLGVGALLFALSGPGPDEDAPPAGVTAQDSAPDQTPPAPPPDSWTSPPDQAIKRPDAAMAPPPRPTKKTGKRPPRRRPDARIRRPPVLNEEESADKEEEVIY